MKTSPFHGIWKTGLLAAGITTVGGIFVMLGGVQITKVIPQIVRGGGYRTFIQIVNPGSTAVTVSASFYDKNGSASSLDIKKDDLKGNVSILPGSMQPTRIAGGGILLLDFENVSSVETNWGFITSDAPVMITATLEVHDASNNLVSLVGLETSPPDMKRFVIPRVRNSATNLDVGFAVVNTGATPASIEVSLKTASNDILGSKTLTLRPKEQTALFAYEFFQGVLRDPEGTSYSYLDFHSSSAQFAASATLQGPNLTGLPLERIE
jgi:hypothetical protein